MSSKKPIRVSSNLDVIELSLAACRLPTLDWVSPCDSIVDVFLNHDYIARTECIPDHANPIYNTKILVQIPKNYTDADQVRFVISDVSDYMSNLNCQVQLQDQVGTASIPLTHLISALDANPISIAITSTQEALQEAIARTQPQLFVHARTPLPVNTALRALKLSFGLLRVPPLTQSGRNADSAITKAATTSAATGQDLLTNRFGPDEFQIAVFSAANDSSQADHGSSLLALTAPFPTAPAASATHGANMTPISIPESSLIRIPYNPEYDGPLVLRLYAAQDIADWLGLRKTMLSTRAVRGLPCMGECIVYPNKLVREQRQKLNALVFPWAPAQDSPAPGFVPQRTDASVALRLVVEEPMLQSANDSKADLIEAEHRRRWTHWSRVQLATYSNYKTVLCITPEAFSTSESDDKKDFQTPKKPTTTGGDKTPLSVATPAGKTGDILTRLVQQHLHRLQMAGEAVLYKLKGSEYVDLDHAIQDARIVGKRCEDFVKNPSASVPNQKVSLSESDRQLLTSRLAWVNQLLEDGTKRLEEIVAFEHVLLIAVRTRDSARIAELIKEAVYERGLGHLKAVRENMAFASWRSTSSGSSDVQKGAKSSDNADSDDGELLASPTHRILNLICLIAYLFVSNFAEMLLQQTPYPSNPLNAEFSSPLLDGKLVMTGLIIALYFFAAKSTLFVLFGNSLPAALRKIIAFGESLTPAVYLMLPFIYGIRATKRASLSVIFALPWELMASIFVIALACAVTAMSSKHVASTSTRGLGYMAPNVLAALLTLFLAGLMPTASSAPGLIAAGLVHLASVLEPQWMPADLGRLAMATAYLVLEDAIRPTNQVSCT